MRLISSQTASGSTITNRPTAHGAFGTIRLPRCASRSTQTEAPRGARYASLLLHIDQHLPDGLDGHVARWFQEAGKAGPISTDSVAWTNLIHTLLHLVVQGVLVATTTLKGLVYPLRNHALASGTEEQGIPPRRPQHLCEPRAVR
jgi:hypothetical protein